jgi:hypothetical protein
VSRSRLLRTAVVTLAAGAIVLLAGSASAHAPGVVLRGFGTAAVDGVAAPGEWSRAARLDFSVNQLVGESAGGSGTLLAMNDATTLYLAVKLVRPTLGRTSVAFEFDSDHDGVGLENGEDTLVLNPELLPSPFLDEFRTNQPPCPTGGICGLEDTSAGGTNDGAGAAANDGQFTFYELAHPLDTADDPHDFGLRVGNKVGFQLSLTRCEAQCGTTDVPSGQLWGDVVITSTNRTPPETDIGSGPGNASITSDPRATFSFAGRDDLISAADLDFECGLDGAAFERCTSPRELVVADGRHTFAVRAIDEALNADQTPAQRTWTVDTAPPTRPKISGPRRTSSRRPTFRFSAVDEIARASELRFRCSFDSSRLRACGRRYGARLRKGRHVLRAQALDRAGNASPVATRIVRVR